MEYGYSEKRKTKKDLKHKRKSRVYKRGGKFRALDVSTSNK
jgi:hypothetical protein